MPFIMQKHIYKIVLKLLYIDMNWYNKKRKAIIKVLIVRYWYG